jgi:hypothetical protein
MENVAFNRTGRMHGSRDLSYGVESLANTHGLLVCPITYTVARDYGSTAENFSIGVHPRD